MRLLLEKGANVDDVGAFGHTPLMFTARVIILSIELIFWQQIFFYTWKMCKFNWIEFIYLLESLEPTRILIENGADIHARNVFGQTALLMAAAAGG